MSLSQILTMILTMKTDNDLTQMIDWWIKHYYYYYAVSPVGSQCFRTVRRRLWTTPLKATQRRVARTTLSKSWPAPLWRRSKGWAVTTSAVTAEHLVRAASGFTIEKMKRFRNRHVSWVSCQPWIVILWVTQKSQKTEWEKWGKMSVHMSVWLSLNI